MVRPVQTPEQFATRFWQRVDQSGGPDACWPWRGSRGSHGYGQVAWKALPKRLNTAHRTAWFLTNGPIPDGLWVLHKCDNRICCNPSHYFLGTVSDNNADMAKKGRARGGRVSGDAHWQRQHPERVRRGVDVQTCRLTPDEVRALRNRYRAGGVTLSLLAGEYGISITATHAAITGKTWKHIP